jgi:outer membrane protein OmpA-like peptidoglycan-associated protein
VGETTQLVSQTYVDNSESVFGSNAKKAIDGAVAQALDSAQCFVDAGLQTGEQDLLGALTLASSSFEQASDMASKTIYVYSNGLQTAGSLKLQESFSKNGEEISATLESEGALPQLDNVTVVFYGLGQVSGEQPAFSSKSGNHLEEIWKSIVERGGGLFVNGGPVSLGNGNPSAPQMSLVQPLQSKPIVSGCKATLTDENLSFQANSSEFLDPELARLSISQVASSFLSQKCRGSVKVTGYTTNYGDETLQNSLSESRAANVANALTDYLPNVEIEVFGNGYDGSGELDQSNRRVEIEVSGR